ncbi:restriction endonuclease [Streptomyces sp. Ru62]|uniref:restriction endonuclease n=1 Tax=Streptomyces sp. Ru62 TaxID=2080745 RepID=UPI000CDD671E|nr:restriction endonuclease [Streptomyces sp. Ru62]POX64614.1 restriction endonuclease [Streptomyces sp. Ru62]
MRNDRRFDLRTTALFFLLLAVLLCLLALVVRTAAGMVERRPLWAGVLAVLGIAAAVLCRSRWRRFSAATYARRAARALEEAAAEAAVPLHPAEEAAVAPRPTAEASVPSRPADEETTAFPGGVVDCAELEPDGFEEAIADLCARDGCQEVEVVGGAGDLGADVTAVTPDGRRVVIQCKQYGAANKVGSQDLQRFGGTCFTIHEADVAAVVTTSDFTAPALEYARQCGIVCVDGRALDAWCHGTGPSPWDGTGIEC